MSQSTTTPTYNKSYSWGAPSTQSSQSIIKSSDNAAGHEKAGAPTAQEQSSAIPVIPRRSSYNYAQDSAQFSNPGGSSAGRSTEAPAGQAGGRVDGELEGLQRKFFHERKKSYTMEDQKRDRFGFMLKSDNNPQSFSEV